MHASRFGLGIIAVLFLIATAVALLPDSVVITSSPRWVIAGSSDKATVNVQVINTSNPSDPVVGAGVMVWCEDSQMGTITPAGIQYIKAGSTNVTYTFRPGTKSGNAVLRVNVTAPGLTVPVDNMTVQRVDHATPASFAALSYPSDAPVANTVDIIVRIKDRYANIVDSLREDDELLIPEMVSFRDSEDYDGGFWNGTAYVNSITLPVNASGYTLVQYRLASTAGDNVISITPPPSVTPSPSFITIKGYGTLVLHMTSVLNPLSGLVRANGIDTISILYTVTDNNGNPIRNANVLRTTSLGETDSYYTNDEGQVMTVYGPKTSIGSVEINATVEGYPLVTVTDTVGFVASEAVLWELTASPQTLASRDVKSDITADVKAKVMDALGNPVQYENVSFSIVSTTTIPSILLNSSPSLAAASAMTDEDGFAIVQFLPGAFYTSGPNYNQTATGISRIRATWNSKTKYIEISFKNYPYLRVETNVTPQTLKVNETVDVEVRLIGDGWALQPNPIDVLLVTDRSGSMLKDQPDDRMVPVKGASKDFAQEMDLSQSKDHVGLVSFGEKGWANLSPTRYYSGGWHWDWSNVYGSWYWVYRDSYNDCNTGDSYNTSSVHHQYLVNNYGGGNKRYADYAGVDIPLNWSSTTINNSINSMVPSGGTPMRLAVYKAIKEMKNTGRGGAVKALIVLSDGDYNWYGDPLARGSAGQTTDPEAYPYRTGDQPNTYYWSFADITASEQNLSVYAANNNVRIYSIGYAADISAYGKTALRTLAESTGGKYYDGDAANIGDIYRTIAGELRVIAGVNTRMNLSFQNVNVTFNNVTSSLPGQEVYQYNYINGISSRITSWNTTFNPLPGHIPAYPYTVDQSSEWNGAIPHLYFDVGNVSINQTWQTRFRLQVLKPGNLNIFGSGSSVNFDGTEGAYVTFMPDTFVTAIENMTMNVTGATQVDVVITGTSANAGELLDVFWNLSYNKNLTVKQDLYYQFSDDNVRWSGLWVPAGTYITGNGPFIAAPATGNIDIRGKSGWMKIRVTAKEMTAGGGYDEDTWPSAVEVRPGERVFIKIS